MKNTNKSSAFDKTFINMLFGIVFREEELEGENRDKSLELSPDLFNDLHNIKSNFIKGIFSLSTIGLIYSHNES